ncbi:MAG: hypothetical protein WBL27_08060 [Salinimicrobium sp.]|jgi:hypothetical protein
MKSLPTSSIHNKIFFLLSILFLLILCASCEKEFIADENPKAVENSNVFNKNGRLYFPSKEIFTQEYEKFKEKDEEEIHELALKMHGENFIPLRPILTEENEEKVYEQLKERSERLRKTFDKQGMKISEDYALDHLDDLEDVIGDEAFANFLNTKAEVQIGNDIYKYTDVGLFITEESNYDGLENYLQVKEISDDLLVPTSEDTKLRMISEVPEGGYTLLENEITYYRAPIDELEPYPYPQEPYPYPGDGGDSGGTPSPEPTPTQTLENFLGTLNQCSASKGLFGDVFGTNRVCIDRYENDRRVKTKAYNYDYGIAFNVGVKVKHQKKGWTGIWRKEDVDEIAMGVEYARFEYSFMPIFTQALQNLDFRETFISPLSSAPTSGVYHFSTNSYGNFVNVDYTYTRYNPYPYELFQSDLIVEVWSYNDLWDSLVNENINESTKSEKLNEYFWSTIWSTTKSKIGKLVGGSQGGDYQMPDDIIYASKHPTIGKVQIFQTLKRRKYNDDKIEKTFDWGVGIQLSLSSKNNFHLLKGNVEPADLQKPKKYHASLFGAVKRNGQWHGSKLKF